jgi:ABC-type branched-subunit amino acid transport system substrate-binding protein
MPRSRWLLPLLLFFFCLPLLQRALSAFGDDNRFIIAVVGDGLTGRDPSPEEWGTPVWLGARRAYEASPSLKQNGLNKIVDLQERDDKGQDSNAEMVARELQSNPKVLAVIGHATSGKTVKAAWLYEQFGIPLIAPAATSPNIMCAPKDPPGIQKYLSILFRRSPCDDPELGHRLNNVFRLPPSDQKAQAPAVATMVERLASPAAKLYLVDDERESTAGYCKPLVVAIRTLLNKTTYAVTPNTLLPNSPDDLDQLARGIQSTDPAGVIICTFNNTAKTFLKSLQLAYSKVPLAQRPFLLMTDGAMDRELDATGFRLFVTFPTKGIQNYKIYSQRGGSAKVEDTDYQLLRSLVDDRRKKGYDESYEMYGYDAMLILGEVARKCQNKSQLGRSCMLQTLREERDLIGVTEAYTFEEGEHLASYYVFAADGLNAQKPKLQYDELLDITKAEVMRWRQE